MNTPSSKRNEAFYQNSLLTFHQIYLVFTRPRKTAYHSSSWNLKHPWWLHATVLHMNSKAVCFIESYSNWSNFTLFDTFQHLDKYFAHHAKLEQRTPSKRCFYCRSVHHALDRILFKNDKQRQQRQQEQKQEECTYAMVVVRFKKVTTFVCSQFV